MALADGTPDLALPVLPRQDVLLDEQMSWCAPVRVLCQYGARPLPDLAVIDERVGQHRRIDNDHVPLWPRRPTNSSAVWPGSPDAVAQIIGSAE